MDPSTVGKEVGHPFIPKIRVKTKVKPSVLQVLVSSSTHGSSGSLDITPQSPLRPFRRTYSRQKTIEESVEREKKGQGLFPSFFFFSFFFLTSLYLGLLFRCVCFLSLFFTNEWPFALLQSKRKSNPKVAKSQSSSDDVVRPPFTYYFSLPSIFLSFLWHCAYILFLDVLSPVSPYSSSIC